jgi:hypothetical protein
MRDVIHIDNLVQECGFFTNRTTVNSGYGCRHPEQRDVEKEHMESLKAMGIDGPPTCGRCFTFTCPLGAELNPSQEEEDAQSFRDAGMDPGDMSDGMWMLVEITDDGRIDGAAPEAE